MQKLLVKMAEENRGLDHAALNALVNIIINYPEPNKVAEFTASNLVKMVAVNDAKKIDVATEH